MIVFLLFVCLNSENDYSENDSMYSYVHLLDHILIYYFIENLIPYETEPDAKGLKNIVTFRVDDDGTKIKETKVIKVVKEESKVPKGVVERKVIY